MNYKLTLSGPRVLERYRRSGHQWLIRLVVAVTNSGMSDCQWQYSEVWRVVDV